MDEKLLSKKSVFAELLHGDCPPYQAGLQLFSHQDPFEASQDRQRQHEVGGILTKNTFISSPEAIIRPPPDCLEMTQSLSLVMFRLIHTLCYTVLLTAKADEPKINGYPT